jgi:hypothetical protein
MAVPYAFSTATTSIPLSQLDANFNTGLTIGNTTVGLGNTVTSLGNLTLANVTILSGTSNIVATGNVTIGNTTVGLGNTITTVGNLTLTNTTVVNYTETIQATTGNVTINLANGTFQNVGINAATTITLPSSVSGKSFTVMASYTSNNTVTWAGGSTLKWAGGTTPTPTATTGKYDIFNFYQDGTNTYGAIYGQNF